MKCQKISELEERQREPSRSLTWEIIDSIAIVKTWLGNTHSLGARSHDVIGSCKDIGCEILCYSEMQGIERP